MLVKLGSPELKALDMFKNPFETGCIRKIYIEIGDNYGIRKPRGIEYTGRITFTNENTDGAQNFTTESFTSLITSMQTFIDSLKPISEEHQK